MIGLTDVLAHQGGRDEFLLVAAPIVIFVVLLRVANWRAQRIEAPDRGGPETRGHLSPPDPDDATNATPDR